MLLLIVAAFLCGSCGTGGHGPGDYLPDPNPVEMITTALEESDIECFTSRLFEDDGLQYSYNFVSVRYLGGIGIGSEEFVLGTAYFIRSSPMGEASPPSRGHGFLLCMTPEFELVSFCELYLPDEVTLSGVELLRGEEVIADFSEDDELIRLNGYLIDGSSFLEYPFSDAP